MDIQSAKAMIRAAILADDSVLLEGAHGIGKSEAPRQLAKEDGFNFEPLFLSHQEVGDLIGTPHTYKDGDETITNWSVPIWLQRMRKKAEQGIPSILFLDEINRAQIDVRQSALQLVLEGQIHEHKLPVVNGQKTVVLAAMNPADDYQCDELDAALLDRFLHISVEVSAPVWLEYARENGINQIVRDFISEFPNRLHWTPEDGGKGSSPRSWVKLSKYIDNIKNIEEHIHFPIMKGKIGTEIGSQFFSFFKNYVDVVKIEDIEKLVHTEEDEVNSIEELAEKISELTENMEAIQKTEMAHQLEQKYMKKDEILPFLAYLYSLDVEVCVAFLKGYRKDNAKGFKKLAEIDDKLNGKTLFKRIVEAASKVA